VSAINRGGPAFPHVQGLGQNVRPGMTLRQWYAGMAMQGFIGSDPATYRDFLSNRNDVAKASFVYADALLAHEEAEAKKQEGEPA
jgi:hypothetical protein